MPRKPKNSNALTDLELAIMNAIWDRDPPTSVENIQETLAERGKPLAGPSIRTMLMILVDKGFLIREQVGKRHHYFAKINRSQVQRTIAQEILSKAFNGSAADLVAALVKDGQLGSDDLRQVKALLEEATARGER